MRRITGTLPVLISKFIHGQDARGTGRHGLVRATFIRYDGGEHACAVIEEIAQVEQAIALLGATLAQRQEPAEACVGEAVGWVDQDVGRIREGEAGANDQLWRLTALVADLESRVIGADDSG